MKIRILLIALTLGATGLLRAQPAECVYCPSYTCYGPCGMGCTCITGPGQMGGSCYGVQQAEAILADGGVELK